MGRLVDWPSGCGIRALDVINGPQTIGAGQSNSIGDVAQTVATPFGAWSYQFLIPVCKGTLARRIRGWVAAMHGGANATRVPWVDGDMQTFAEVGLNYSIENQFNGIAWSNGNPWSNGQGWKPSYPFVSVASASAKGQTLVRLSDTWWGRALGIGDIIGFSPFHFGKYMVTEVLGDGLYRVWPPLRAAITTADFATLKPVLAMRMTSADAAKLSRSVDKMEETTIIMTEVFDADVRTYFTA